MIERDIEDLIAAYPDEFFPRKHFVLKGRQRSFAGIGRFDLFFQDSFDTNILMELKARCAKYEDATQLARYKDELDRLGEKHILMWLVAPQIPTSVREFLDRIGIEYSEIHEAEFRRVALRNGAVIQSEVKAIEPAPAVATASLRLVPTGRLREARLPIKTGPAVTAPSKFRWKAFEYDLALQNPEEFEAEKFAALVDSFERAVPSRKNATVLNALRLWARDPQHARWPRTANSSLLRWTTTSSYREAISHALAIWKYLFGEPVPTWYQWRQAEGRYHFDRQAWATWYQSLARAMKSVEAIYKEHHDPSARDWPLEKQCQCEDCKAYRNAHPLTSSL